VSSISAADATDLLAAAKVTAIVRARDSAEKIAAAGALAAGGLKDRADLRYTVCRRGTHRGALSSRRRGPYRRGTITTYDQVLAAVAAGRDFPVSSHLDTTLLDATVSTGSLSLPGALTPSEAAAALRQVPRR
jgi:2-dehydro-3-deoxyphosphogluconate aldolase/(4S)-4-hydroxy-2-oxoglutarate aldolase